MHWIRISDEKNSQKQQKFSELKRNENQSLFYENFMKLRRIKCQEKSNLDESKFFRSDKMKQIFSVKKRLPSSSEIGNDRFFEIFYFQCELECSFLLFKKMGKSTLPFLFLLLIAQLMLGAHSKIVYSNQTASVSSLLTSGTVLFDKVLPRQQSVIFEFSTNCSLAYLYIYEQNGGDLINGTGIGSNDGTFMKAFPSSGGIALSRIYVVVKGAEDQADCISKANFLQVESGDFGCAKFGLAGYPAYPICSECSTGFTLRSGSTYGSNQICVSNEVQDSNGICSQLEDFNNQIWSCQTCSSGTSRQKFYLASFGQQIYRCFKPDAVILYCLSYQLMATGSLYECRTCGGASINRYQVGYNGLTMYRCLNASTEYQRECTLYNQSNICLGCDIGYGLVLTISNTYKCISKSYIVSNCSVYFVDMSGIAICSQCNDGYSFGNVNFQKKCILQSQTVNQCSNYVLNNGVYYCQTCNSPYSPVNVYLSPDKIVINCLNGTETIRDCNRYEIINGVYSCNNCSSTTEKYLTIVNSVTAYRCLNPFTEYLANCTTYQYSISNYTCQVCDNGYTMTTVYNNSIAQSRCLITSTQLISNCKKYKTGQQGYYDFVCQTCASGYKTSPDNKACVQLTPGEIVTNCVAVRIDDPLKCKSCDIGWIVNVEGTACLESVATRDISGCIEAKFSDPTKCNKCSEGLVLSSDFLHCSLNVGENCMSVSTQNSISTCTACQSTYTLIKVRLNGQIYQKCVSQSELAQHCSVYKLVNGKFVCQTCNSGYRLAKIRTGSTLKEECALAQFVFVDCEEYQHVGNICVVQCVKCALSYHRLVQVLELNRIRHLCINVNTQLLPSCKLYIKDNSQYYCKQGHCETSSVEISIGASPKAIACSSFSPISQCDIYQRPALTSPELRCQKCHSDTLTLPYCQ